MEAEKFLELYKAKDMVRATVTKGNNKSGCPYYKWQLFGSGTSYVECSEASRFAEANGAKVGETMLQGITFNKLCSWQPCVCSLFIRAIKRDYPIGTKLRLIHMEGEPQMVAGITGTVNHVDDMGQIHVDWETGSSLALTAYIDRFTRI